MGRSGILTVVALLALIPPGCGSTEEQRIGRPWREVARGWGPPNDVRPDGNGGRIMVWAAPRHEIAEYREGVRGDWDHQDDLAGITAGPDVATRTRHHYGYLLYVDSFGMVYGYEWIAR